jgi:hypothetical protein
MDKAKAVRLVKKLEDKGYEAKLYATATASTTSASAGSSTRKGSA